MTFHIINVLLQLQNTSDLNSIENFQDTIGSYNLDIKIVILLLKQKGGAYRLLTPLIIIMVFYQFLDIKKNFTFDYNQIFQCRKYTWSKSLNINYAFAINLHLTELSPLIIIVNILLYWRNLKSLNYILQFLLP